MDLDRILRDGGKLPPMPMQQQIDLKAGHDPTLDVSGAVGFLVPAGPGSIVMQVLGGCSNLEIAAREIFPKILEQKLLSHEQLNQRMFEECAEKAVDAAVALKVALHKRMKLELEKQNASDPQG